MAHPRGKGPASGSPMGKESPKRVFFLNRTSEVVGSFTKSDIKSHSSLIRRKIQERCATTQDLMQTIRRIKTGDAGFVTPTEFRFTLMKLGVMLDENVVNELFNMFDTDRSGTMDFDEFATWIMNSEFRPSDPVDRGVKIVKEAHDVVLRRHFTELMRECPSIFSDSKHYYSFVELISELNRRGIKSVSEYDVRCLFMHFDPRKTDSIDVAKVKRWLDTGVIDLHTPVGVPKSAPDVNTALRKVCGRTPELLLKAFEYARGQKNVHYNEFKTTVMSCGLGQNIDDVRNLFFALSNGSDSADIDLLLAAAAKLQQVINFQASSSTDTGGGRSDHAASFSEQSRADRKIRQEIRRTFAHIRSALEYADTSKCGYIDADDLWALIVKHCTPLTYHDFRVAVKRVAQDPNNPTRYNYQHFLDIYNPLRAPHELEGGSTATVMPPPASKSPKKARGPAASSGGLAIQGASSSNTSSATNLSATQSEPNLRNVGASTSVASGAAALADVKRIWVQILRTCQRADPNKSGCINRTQFIAAVQKALQQSMSSQSINNLADMYQCRDGLIDYKACFRHTLNDIASTLPVSDDSSVFKPQPASKARASGPLHPWEFDYVKHETGSGPDDPQQVPHWRTACLKPREVLTAPPPLEATNSLKIATLPKRSHPNSLSVTEVQSQLAKYDPKVVAVCARLAQTWRPFWKQLLSGFHERRIKNHPGHISTNSFFDILASNRLRISKSDYTLLSRYFKTIGLNDVFRYSDFVEICTLSKSLERSGVGVEGVSMSDPHAATV